MPGPTNLKVKRRGNGAGEVLIVGPYSLMMLRYRGVDSVATEFVFFKTFLLVTNIFR